MLSKKNDVLKRKGFIYKGDVSHGKMHGSGIFIKSENEFYVGDF